MIKTWQLKNQSLVFQTSILFQDQKRIKKYFVITTENPKNPFYFTSSKPKSELGTVASLIRKNLPNFKIISLYHIPKQYVYSLKIKSDNNKEWHILLKTGHTPEISLVDEDKTIYFR